MSTTFFTSLLEALTKAGAYNQQYEEKPAAILWPDEQKQWESLVPRLCEELPWLFILGDYNPDERTGPAIWLRCVIARTLADVTWPEGEIPILYLPGWSKQDLRAVQDCPREIAPLAELQYRGKLWTQENGKDWTIAAFLQNETQGLNVRVDSDNATKDALRGALLKLANVSVRDLRADAPINSSKIHNLVNPEPVGDLLQWMNDPNARRDAMEKTNDWEGFCSICKERWNFDPRSDGESVAAEHLGERARDWAVVWSRFAESPQRYPNLPDLLERAKPADSSGLFYDRSSWPQENAEAEVELRAELGAMHNLTHATACKHLRELENKHRERRNWVWADLGQAPLAKVLLPLLDLANATQTPCGGSTPTEIAESYAAQGWTADAAMLKSLATAEKTEDMAAVKLAVEALYREWLRTTAEAFQRAVREHALPEPSKTMSVDASAAGKCYLFADGLRLDVANFLMQELHDNNLTADLKWQFSALPGVTSTAKPAVSPVASLLGPGADFETVVLANNSKVNIDVLRRELEAHGFPVLKGDDVGTDAQRQRGAAWTECGSLDSYGHAQGSKLAMRIKEEVRYLCERVQMLLNAGWREVQIITDHGWLLLPGNLPKASLPEHLTEKRKGRCARLKEGSVTDMQTVPWFWDNDVNIAMAPGICCFEDGKEYEHGGLSPQECVIPIIKVSNDLADYISVSIAKAVWMGLRCRVEIAGGTENLSVDIRTKVADPITSVIGGPKPIDANGKTSLLVENEGLQGTPALVVVLKSDGSVLAKVPTAIGE